jgi:ferrous iron transport protein B
MKVCPIIAKHIKVALVGQPNVGKSMLINSVSNAHLHVGNFSGVTVDKTEVLFDYKDYHFTVVDLPGTYAFTDFTIEEKVTHKYLCNEDYDLIINVVDSTNLEKNLQLTSELLTMNKKIVIALNMSDEAQKEGILIDEKYMSELLNVPCIKVSAAAKTGIEELIECVTEVYAKPKVEPKLIFSEAVEEEIEKIVAFLEKHHYDANNSYRNVAINLLQNKEKTYERISKKAIWTELQPIVVEALHHIELHHNTDDLKEAFAEEYAAFNRGIIAEVVSYKEAREEQKSLTEKIDSILIHPLYGIPIFLFLMWGLFQLTFVLGALPMDWISSFFDWFGSVVGSTISNDEARSLIVDGLISGVGAVILFTPNIIILFIGIALLETTGYMSRVAFLLDGFFHKFGLHGQSFIPLVTGFGCSIPAYMSARILKNDRDRLLTLFIISFMSCGARLPVYVLFAGAFFSEAVAGNVLFGIYITGAAMGLIAAKVLKMTAFKGVDEPFVMEMPKYRLPTLRLLLHTVWGETKMYLRKAGTFIAGATVLIWFLSNYPHNAAVQERYAHKIEQASSLSEKNILHNELAKEQLESSYLGTIGKLSEPLFKPLGLDWKMAVALEAGIAAKEVIVSTLGVLYSLGDSVDAQSHSLKDAISKNISFPSAVAFIIVIMVYLPCFAASIVFTREAGGIKYFFYLLIFTSVTAYVLAFLGYHITLLLGY